MFVGLMWIFLQEPLSSVDFAGVSHAARRGESDWRRRPVSRRARTKSIFVNLDHSRRTQIKGS